NPLTLGGGGDGEHLRRPQHLAKTLVLSEIKSTAAAVVDLWKHHRAAVSKPEFIADKRRNASFVRHTFVIKIVARIEGGITREFEETAVDLVGAGFGHNVSEARGALTDLGLHHARTGLYFLDGIHVEIGKSGASKLRIGGVEPVEGKDGGGPALSIHRELRGKVGGAVGVGHGAGRQQQQLAEVARVQRQAGNLATGKMLPSAALHWNRFGGPQEPYLWRLGRKLEPARERG